MKFNLFFLLFLIPQLLFSQFSVMKQTNSLVVIEFQIKDLQASVIELNGVDYTFYQFPGSVIEQQSGKPAIPYVQSRLAVPFGAEVKTQLAVLESETKTGVDVLPQYSIDLGDKRVEIPRDESIYLSVFPFPEDQLEIGEAYEFRGVNVVSFRVNPVQYFPLNHQVVVHKRIRITIEFKGGKPLSSPVKLSAYERGILSQKIINDKQAALFRVPASKSFLKTTVNYDLSTGQWFKIPIKEEGIYQISGSFLRSQNIDISSIQLSGIHLYNYSGFALSYNVADSRPEDLNEIAVKIVDEDQDDLMDDSDRIIFYGKGLGGWKYRPGSGDWIYTGNPDGTRTLYPYDDTNYYLLVFTGQPGKRMAEIPSAQLPNPEVPVSFTDYFHFEIDAHNILFSGLDWYWLRMLGVSDKKTTPFVLPQNLADDTMRMEFAFHGGSGSILGDLEPYSYSLKGFINSQLVFDNFSLSRTQTKSRVLNYNSLTAIVGGSNQLEIQHSGNLEGCEVYLDYFEIQFKRPFIAESGYLHFRGVIPGNAAVEYRISGLSSGNNMVWDISDLDDIKDVIPLQNGIGVTFQAFSAEEAPVDYFVFSPSVIKNVETVESIDNHPNLRDPFRKAELLIITPDEFYDAAEFLEVWRETQIPNRLEVERVKLSEIFLEFSSGVRDVTALRDFIHYVYDNWSDTLKYVLLFGDGHYDYRNLRLGGFPNYVPPFEISNPGEVDSRETDNYYVAFGMTGSLGTIDPFLPIARLPLSSFDQIETYRDKSEKYSKSYLIEPERNGWQTWLTFVSDDEVGNSGSNHELSYHLEPTEYIIKNYILRKFNVEKVYLHDFEKIPGGLGRWKPKATEKLVNRINRGTLLINYFGHGDPDTWAHESVLNRTRDLSKFQNDYRLPLWVAATCTWGKYDNPSRPSMSEELLWRFQQGAIGVISASRPVFVSGNKIFAFRLFENLFNNRSEILPSKILGDAFFSATSSAPNFQKFHLYADPTMKLADPQHLVEIESVQPDTLKALSTAQIEARLTDTQGTALQDFNGFAVIEVIDALEETFVEDGNQRYDYVYNGGTIFKGLVTVSAGELSGRFIVPKSIKYDPSSTGRVSIYAWSKERGDAVGYSDTLLFFSSEKQVDDKDGPDILVSFKEFPGFFDGDFVSSQPTLLVELEDENGVNLTGEVGHRIEVFIDDNVKKDVTEFFVYDINSYQEGQLEYTLPALSPGIHHLKIICWDNLNNFSERELSFRTSSASELVIEEVVNFPNPFSDRTHFTFQLLTPSGSADVTISVYTVTGRKIYEIKDVASAGFNRIPAQGWDARDWDGDLIANGVYLYKIVVDDGEKKIEKIDKLAVVR